MFLENNELLIHDGNYHQFVEDQVVDGEKKSRGCIPRNYSTHPRGCYGEKSFDMPVTPRGEWPDRIKELDATSSKLSDMRMKGNNGGMIPSRDQNGKGYCWAHSTTSASLLVRCRDNQPYADLSAYAIACIIKGYQDEGGWGAESLDWVIKNGIPTSTTWPQQSMSRSNDNQAMRAEAALHKICETWMDVSQDEGSRVLTFDQVATCLLCREPVVTDFNWWSHSVCGADLVNGQSFYGKTRAPSGKLLQDVSLFDKVWGMDSDTGGFGLRIWNSWGDSWSQQGMGVLSGSKAIPDGAVCPRTVTASAA